MIAAPSQSEASAANATRRPRTTMDDKIAGSTSGTAIPAEALAKPTSMIATNAIGQTRMARPPASAPQTPTASMATRWSAPCSGWANPDTNEAAHSGIIGSLPNGVVNGDEFGAVEERRFHFYLLDHLGDAVHDLIARQ